MKLVLLSLLVCIVTFPKYSYEDRKNNGQKKIAATRNALNERRRNQKFQNNYESEWPRTLLRNTLRNKRKKHSKKQALRSKTNRRKKNPVKTSISNRKKYVEEKKKKKYRKRGKGNTKDAVNRKLKSRKRDGKRRIGSKNKKKPNIKQKKSRKNMKIAKKKKAKNVRKQTKNGKKGSRNPRKNHNKFNKNKKKTKKQGNGKKINKNNKKMNAKKSNKSKRRSEGWKNRNLRKNKKQKKNKIKKRGKGRKNRNLWKNKKLKKNNKSRRSKGWKNRNLKKNKKQKKNNKSKRRGKGGKNRNKKKNSKQKSQIVGIDELYHVKAGQRQKNFQLYSVDWDVNVNISYNNSYPTLESHNVSGAFSIIRLNIGSKTDEFEPNVELRRYNTGVISISRAEIGTNETNGKRYIKKRSLQYIYRCWRFDRQCVADWNRDCLNTMFNGTVLKILESKRGTSDGKTCPNWNETIHNDYKSTVENRCVLKMDGIFLYYGYPYCMEGSYAHPCFRSCNPDLATIVLTNKTEKMYLKRPFGENVIIFPRSEEFSVYGKNKTGSMQSMRVLRCYDKKRDCVANAYGSCLDDVFDYDVVRVFSNNNVTVDGEPCLYWNTTVHRNDVPYPNSNLCTLPTDSAWNGDGPWCHRVRSPGHGPCFPACESLRPRDESASLWDNPENWISYDSDPPYPLLDNYNRVARLKLKSTLRHRSNYAILNWYVDGSIKVSQFVVSKNRSTNVSYVDSGVEKDIKRCYNPVKNCVAQWNGVCLKDSFSGIVLKVLLTEAYGINGLKCDSWELLPIPGFGNLTGNRCITDSSVNNDGPFCFTGGKKNSCFYLCQIDVAKQVLGPDNTVVVLRQLQNKRITMKWLNRKQFYIAGESLANGTITYNETIEICYNKKESCLSIVNDSCAQWVYPEDVVTILNNRVLTRSGKTCIDWTTSPLHIYGSVNAPLNLCSIPKANYYEHGKLLLNVNGPWCYTKEDGDLGPENCFDDCDRGNTQSTPVKLRDCGDQYVYHECDAVLGVSLQVMKTKAERFGCRLKIFKNPPNKTCADRFLNQLP